jgi:DNA replication protein DnaC
MNGFKHEERTVTLVCPKHGGYTGEAIKFNLWGIEIKPMCPVCKREIDSENDRKEAECRQRKAIKRLQSMGIEPKFYDSTFDNFDAYNAELRGHLETCRKFSEKPAGKLVMLGEHGNGKTHLAASVLKASGGGVIYKAFEIGINLRQAYWGGANEWEIFNELCTVPLLVIDEVEKIKDSESKQNWMSYVVGKRYDRLLPIIFIANCHTQNNCREKKSPCPHCIEYHLENDVLSRIIEDGIIMNFTSGDYREKIRDARRGRGS